MGALRRCSKREKLKTLVPKIILAIPRNRTLILEDYGDDMLPARWTVDMLIHTAALLARLGSHQELRSLPCGFRRRLHPDKELVTLLERAKFSQAKELVRDLFEQQYDGRLYHALSHGDLVRANLHCASDRIRLIDWEHSEVAPLARDLAGFFLAMPTAICPRRIDKSTLIAMRERFFDELRSVYTKMCLEAAFGASLAFWLALTLQTHLGEALKNDATWGDVSNRTRVVARLQMFLEWAPALPKATIAAAERLIAHLEDQWGKTKEMPLT